VLAAVKNTTLEKYQRLATKLGLENPVFEIESFSFLRSALHGDMQLLLCIDIGSQYTTVTLVRSGSILDLHVISQGSLLSTMRLSQALSLPVTAAEETKRTFGYMGDDSNPFIKEVMQLSSYPLFGEVARLLLMYERKYNQVIEGIIVGGGGARTPGILDALHESVQTASRTATPFDQVEVPAFLKEMITKIGPSYAVATGLALKKLQSS
jgi:Tfp pilus assembly PilM family ATPase